MNEGRKEGTKEQNPPSSSRPQKKPGENSPQETVGVKHSGSSNSAQDEDPEAFEEVRY